MGKYLPIRLPNLTAISSRYSVVLEARRVRFELSSHRQTTTYIFQATPFLFLSLQMEVHQIK